MRISPASTKVRIFAEMGVVEHGHRSRKRASKVPHQASLTSNAKEPKEANPSHKLKFCMYHLQGVCKHTGNSCPYAHSIEEIHKSHGRKRPTKAGSKSSEDDLSQASTSSGGTSQSEEDFPAQQPSRWGNKQAAGPVDQPVPMSTLGAGGSPAFAAVSAMAMATPSVPLNAAMPNQCAVAFDRTSFEPMFVGPLGRVKRCSADLLNSSHATQSGLQDASQVLHNLHAYGGQPLPPQGTQHVQEDLVQIQRRLETLSHVLSSLKDTADQGLAMCPIPPQQMPSSPESLPAFGNIHQGPALLDMMLASRLDLCGLPLPCQAPAVFQPSSLDEASMHLRPPPGL